MILVRIKKPVDRSTGFFICVFLPERIYTDRQLAGQPRMS
jgi:hypothetical protein